MSDCVTAMSLNENTTLNLDTFKAIDFGFKIELINKILHDDQLCLTSLQLINFINYYFQDNSEEIDPVINHNISIIFPCIACSAKFSYEQTFHLHLDRRAVYIKLYCIECKQYKVFFNKCKLFYHVYSHKNNLFQPIYRHVQIDQIPLDKAISQNPKHLASVQYLLSSIQSLKQTDLNINLSINNKFKLNEQDLSQIKLFLKRLYTNRFLVYKCCVCDALFLDYKDLKLHFVQSKKIDSEYSAHSARNYFKILKEKFSQGRIGDADESGLDLLNSFSLEKLQYSIKCSQLVNLSLIDVNFKLSQSSAMNRQSLVCPECGLLFDYSMNKNYVELFRLHLKYDCLFTLRYDLDEYNCVFDSCKFTFTTVNQMLNHWVSDHVIKGHKCEFCVNDETVFYDTEKQEANLSAHLISQINKHYFEKHRNEPVRLKTYIECQCRKGGLCDADKCDSFTSLKACKSHLIDQINKSMVSIDCFMCKKYVLCKDYVAHIKSEHGEQRVYVCPECGPCQGQEPTLHIHIIRNHLSKSSHKKSHFLLMNEVDIAKRTDIYVYLCLNCRLFFSSESKLCHNCWSLAQPINSPNYFSPIYLKINVCKAVNWSTKKNGNGETLFETNQVIKIVNNSFESHKLF